VVSALSRRVEPRSKENQALDLFGLFSDNTGPRRAYARVIQHDSPIDGDKHGAPLCDADGRLVGINVANVYRGSAYAAPIDEIAAFLDDLKQGKAGPPLPRPGFIGVTVGAIRDRDLARELKVIGPGAEIHAVTPGLPADRAGLRSGDVVVRIDGERVGSLERFGQLVRSAAPGQTLRVRVLREGKEVEVGVVATEQGDDD
jgi:serine protease Do